MAKAKDDELAARREQVLLDQAVRADRNDEDDDVEEPEEESWDTKERKAEYLSFKRKMDEYKGAQEGMTSESESFKKQGNAYFTFGCYSQATIMYSEALELQPHNHVLFCNRSMAYLKQDMPEMALADAETSLEIEFSVDNIKAYWRQAQALLDLDRFEESEAAADAGIALQPHNPQINKVRRKAREASVVKRLLAGHWAGKLDNGIEQTLSFSADGEMTMSVFGHSLTSTYELSVEGNPRSMVVRMKQEVIPGQRPAPPMVYIFQFQSDDKELWLCHNVDGQDAVSGAALPTKFEGSGLVKHRRVEAAAPVTEIVSDEPMDVRCVRYMQEMNKILPLHPPQLPEKPSDTQIQEEVEMCGKVSQLRRLHGLEVHQRAVELAKAPADAPNEELKGLATDLRKRFIARRLLTEAPKVKLLTEPPKPPAPVAPAAVAQPPAATKDCTPSDRGNQEVATNALGRMVGAICGCGRSA